MAPVLLVVPLAPVPPMVGVPAVPAGLLLMVLPVAEVPVADVLGSVLFMVAPLAGVPIVPPALVESGMPPTLVAAESVPSVLLGVLVEAPLPPQLPRKKPPATRAARARPEREKDIRRS